MVILFGAKPKCGSAKQLYCLGMLTTRYNSFCISEACQFNCPRGNSCHDLHSKPVRMLILPVSIDCLKHCLSLELSLELAPRSLLPCQDVSQPRKSARSAFEWSNNKREKEQASVQRLKSFSQEKNKQKTVATRIAARGRQTEEKSNLGIDQIAI